MQTYSDEYIEYWADIYLAHQCLKDKIYFEGFLQNPQAVINAVNATDKLHSSLDELENLLPGFERDDINDDEAMQEEMDRRYERKGHVVEMQGDKTIEKFHHHDPAKKWKTNTGNKSRRAS